jgi:hypothetical protein
VRYCKIEKTDEVSGFNLNLPFANSTPSKGSEFSSDKKRKKIKVKNKIDELKPSESN